MLSYCRAPAAVEGVLLGVNQAVARRLERSGGARRALRRSLSRAASRIERTPDYQRSLGELSRLAESFQAALEPEQLRQWLLLEEAMLEHVARLNRSYFYAGAAWKDESRQSIRPRESGARAPAHRSSERRSDLRGCHGASGDAEAIIALARLISELSKR